MMNSIKVRRNELLTRDKRAKVINAKSGLEINIMDDEWKILPTKHRGHTIPLAWLHNSVMPDEDWHLMVDVYTHYIRTKAASTAYGVVCNTQTLVSEGIPTLAELKAKWSGLPTHHKKSINQFFSTLYRLGHKRFADHHNFTTNHLDKENRNSLDPAKGALSNFEFDSLAKLVNNKLASIDWLRQNDLSFYQSRQFSEVRTVVANKLMLATVRRPIQLSILKWSDLIPSGASFNDKDINALNEIGTLGAQTLQLRVFHAKEKGSAHRRCHPERHPLHLSEELSLALIRYKQFCLRGLSLIFIASDLEIEQEELLHIANNVPVFPDIELFRWEVHSIETFKNAFTPASTLFHASDQRLTLRLDVPSDRAAICTASNNRIRHTVLTRGAQQGLPAVQLARITGVTVPAAKHYVDIDYDSRRLIDDNYLGNEFLKRAFSGLITLAPQGDETIFGHDFNEVGGAQNKGGCKSCKTLLGRPLGCYGCPNFRPILEADHRAELQVAQDKLEANRTYLFNPLEINSIRRLERQIEWIKLTITVCDDILARQRGIDAKQVP